MDIFEAVFLTNDLTLESDGHLYFLENIVDMKDLVLCMHQLFDVISMNRCGLREWHMVEQFEKLWESLIGKRTTYSHLLRHLVEVIGADKLQAAFLSAENIEISQKLLKKNIGNNTNNVGSIAKQLLVIANIRESYMVSEM